MTENPAVTAVNVGCVLNLESEKQALVLNYGFNIDRPESNSQSGVVTMFDLQVFHRDEDGNFRANEELSRCYSQFADRTLSVKRWHHLRCFLGVQLALFGDMLTTETHLMRSVEEDVGIATFNTKQLLISTDNCVNWNCSFLLFSPVYHQLALHSLLIF